MIKRIIAKNFKSLKSIDYKAYPLNILMGTNGAGKSTFIQLLLLFKQFNPFYDVNSKYIILNGDILSLGTLQDIFYCYSNEDNIVISLYEEKCCPNGINFTFPFKNEDANNDFAEFSVKTNGDQDKVFKKIIDYCNNIQYISANRLAPQQEHIFNTSHLKNRAWGIYGENAVAYLSENRDKPIGITNLSFEKNSKLSQVNDGDLSLLSQVCKWMSVISPGTQIHIDKMPNISKTILSISFASGISQHKFRPQNVGFGISYTLPILVMLLSAKPGDCLIIENPESHIHPKGQSRLGLLLAAAANEGVQIFVETHSDHIVNGIRVAVKEEVIKNNSVNFTFFSQCFDFKDMFEYEQYTEIENIHVDKYGELSDYPDGFMDEWNNQLINLL